MYTGIALSRLESQIILPTVSNMILQLKVRDQLLLPLWSVSDWIIRAVNCPTQTLKIPAVFNTGFEVYFFCVCEVQSCVDVESVLPTPFFRLENRSGRYNMCCWGFLQKLKSLDRSLRFCLVKIGILSVLLVQHVNNTVCKKKSECSELPNPEKKLAGPFQVPLSFLVFLEEVITTNWVLNKSDRSDRFF